VYVYPKALTIDGEDGEAGTRGGGRPRLRRIALEGCCRLVSILLLVVAATAGRKMHASEVGNIGGGLPLEVGDMQGGGGEQRWRPAPWRREICKVEVGNSGSGGGVHARRT
jgi:hypothetical protein